MIYLRIPWRKENLERISESINPERISEARNRKIKDAPEDE